MLSSLLIAAARNLSFKSFVILYELRFLKSVREEEKRNRTETKSPVIHKRRLSRNDVIYESSDKLYDFQTISTNENEA